MLVLSRKLNESVMIGDDVEVIVLDVREGVVKLGIKAPREISGAPSGDLRPDRRREQTGPVTQG